MFVLEILAFRATYLAGELLCSAVDMVRLSAILCQITKGNYSDYKSVENAHSSRLSH